MTMRFIPTLRSEATFKEFFDSLNWKKGAWPPLDRHEVRSWCDVYLDNPNIRPDWRFLKLLMWTYMQVVENIPITPEEIAEEVKSLMALGLSEEEAIANVAERNGIIQQTHQAQGGEP